MTSQTIKPIRNLNNRVAVPCDIPVNNCIRPWPWSAMNVGDRVAVTEPWAAVKAQKSVHSYAVKTGRKFKTRRFVDIATDDPFVTVERI